jgi:DNA uptake protein ComE-like DNA-binding protein
METKILEEKLQKVYNKRYKTIEKRVSTALHEVEINEKDLSLEDIKTIASLFIEKETQKLEDDVEKLLEQKEAIERALEKKSEELQEKKYEVFHALEEEFKVDNALLVKLHQIKLQSIDLYDILSEMVESAIITALEKDTDGDITEPTKEVIKEITFESIKEGSLNTIRVRKILSTILATAIEVAEATPNRAEEILGATLKGMRSGLIQSIDRFKKRLAFMPVEAKHILIEDYDTIIEDLNQSDRLFSQVVVTQASESSQTIRKILIDLNTAMQYDLEELVHISKETAEIMKERFSSLAKLAVKKADSALNSPKAKEAKRMGIQAFSVAKEALGQAIKSAKDVIDKK